MNNLALDLLFKLNACSEAKEWVGERTMQQAWDDCPRGDWMLWIYSKLYPRNLRELTLAKGHCANTVRHLMKNHRSLSAVDAAIAFGEGKVTRDELDSADAADAADADDADAAYADAEKIKNQRETADICRRYLSFGAEVVE